MPPPHPPDVATPAPAAPTASSAPSAAVPPPAAGLERRTLELGEKQGEGLAVALDVPAEWGTGHSSGIGTPEVRLCRDGPRIEIRERSGNIALELKLMPDEQLRTAKRENPAPDREWIIRDFAGGGGKRTIDARLLVEVPGGSRFVECILGPLQDKNLALFGRFKAACESLSFPPSGSSTAPVAPRATPADLELPSDPDEKGAADAAVRFFVAVQKGEEKEARALLSGPEGCTEKQPKKQAACLAKLQVARREAIPKAVASLPAGFQPGSVEVNVLPPKLTEGLFVALVTVHTRADECGKGVGALVMKAGARFSLLPMVSSSAQK
jgi:hypothetical protein